MQERSILWQERAQLKTFFRAFFAEHAFLEVETPTAVVMPGTEVHLNYFSTQWQHHAYSKPLYLRSSPEIALKKLLCEQSRPIFEFARCFRNGTELGPWHNPEFTMLEYYQPQVDFDDFVLLTQKMFEYTAERYYQTYAISPISQSWLAQRWQKLSVYEAFREYAGIELIDADPDLARQACAAGIISTKDDDDFETAYFKILIERIEPEIKNMSAVVLYDFPPSQAALAQVHQDRAQRFEVYIQGVELCNAFHELVGFEENRARIRQDEAKRQALGHHVPQTDDDTIRAWTENLSPCCGNAVGFERWLALLHGLDSIDRCFPRSYQASQPSS